MFEAAGWDAYFALVRTRTWDEVESELRYKRATERFLRSVTNEVLSSSNRNWIYNAAKADRKNLEFCGGWRKTAALAKWYGEEPRRVAEALRGLWVPYDGSPDGLPPRDEVFARIRTFAKQLPFVKNLRGAGGRMALTSALLMRISAEHYPPFKVTMFTKVYELTGHPQPPQDADEATLYEHALEFLDKFVEEAQARRLEWPSNLLEAQSVVHMLRYSDPNAGGRPRAAESPRRVDHQPDSVSASAGWDAYFALVRNLEWAAVESDELQYKRAAERYLRSVTNEVLSSKDNWIDAARDRGNFRRYLNKLGGGWRRMTYLAKWWDEEPERVAAALRDLWALYDGSSDGLPSRDEVFTRIRRFAKELPFVDKNLRRPGGRLGLISALLIRISVEHYPPFKVRMFTTAYELTNHPKPPDDADEATLYRHALEFLDKFVEESLARRREWPRNLLEAESVVHMLRYAT